MNKKETISKTQLTFLLIQTQIGVGLLSLPYVVHLDAKNDGWISILLAGVVVSFCVLAIWFLCKRYPHKIMYEFINEIVGVFLGKTATLLYVIYFYAVSVLVVLLSTSMIKKWILALTPQWFLILFMVWVGVYLAKESIKIIARFDVFVTILVILLIILLLFVYNNVNYKYLFPIGHSGVKPILMGSHDAVVSMLGFELLLFVYPKAEATEKQILLCASLSTISVTILYVFFTVTSFISFSPDEIPLVPEPILYMLKALSFEIVERLDLFFLSVWIVPMTTSFVSYLYMSSVGMSKVLNKKNHKMTTIFIGAIVTITCFLLPKSESFMDMFGKMVSVASYIFIVGIPLFLLALSAIRTKFSKGKKNEA